MNRRAFINRTAAAASALGASAATAPLLLDHLKLAAAEARRVKFERNTPAKRALRILILGGTGFIGPHQVHYARARGHTLTLFNRGQSSPGMFPDVEQLRGDRNGDLRSLEGRSWDAVIDNSGFEPKQVRDSARLLESRVARYLFVSTQSVYADRSIIGQDETGAVGTAGVHEDQWRGYGPLKALCEKELLKVFAERAIIVRPAVIVGPGDESDRFTYWVDRIDRGGEVLAPNDPRDPTQFIDVRDLTEWMIHLLENTEQGTYNATGPAAPLSMAELLYGIRAITTARVSFTWVDAAFLAANRVRAFSDLPLWQPPVGRTAGFMRMSAERARSKGLTYRPLAVTAKETLDWWKTLPAGRRAKLEAGLTSDREAELLRAWHAQKSG